MLTVLIPEIRRNLQGCRTGAPGLPAAVFEVRMHANGKNTARVDFV